MRAAVLAGVFVFTASVAGAHPFAAAFPDPQEQPARLTLPSEDRLTADFARHGRPDSVLIASPASSPAAVQTSFSIVSSPVETDPRLGRRRQILQYRVEGMNVLGGAVSGAVDGRGAMIALHWPSGQ